jgi:ABC-type branched-subunit amino acid transport system ATPase component
MRLASRIIDEIFETLVKLSQNGVAGLLVEQYVSRALKVAPTTSTRWAAVRYFSGPRVAGRA